MNDHAEFLTRLTALFPSN